jgi:hypothetical protein
MRQKTELIASGIDFLGLVASPAVTPDPSDH